MKYGFAAVFCITLLISSATWAAWWWWGATGVVYAAKEADVTVYWTHTKPIYPLIAQLSEGKEYHELLHITDEREDVVRQIVAFSRAMSAT